jgi:hypothetical protein
MKTKVKWQGNNRSQTSGSVRKEPDQAGSATLTTYLYFVLISIFNSATNWQQANRNSRITLILNAVEQSGHN